MAFSLHVTPKPHLRVIRLLQAVAVLGTGEPGGSLDRGVNGRRTATDFRATL